MTQLTQHATLVLVPVKTDNKKTKSMNTQKPIKLKTGETLPAGLPVSFIPDEPFLCLVQGPREQPYKVRMRAAFTNGLSQQTIMAAVDRQMHDLENPGFCVVCGTEANCCEPDARNYTCDSCGCPTVYGAEELLIHMA